MQGVSDTTIAVVNQYADDLELAKAVAHILSYDYSTFLDETIGMLSAKIQTNDKTYNAKYQAIYDVYNTSSVKGQFMGAASVYSNYEIMLNKIWDGGDVSETVDEFVSGLSPKVDMEEATDAETAADTENGTNTEGESNISAD